MADTLNTIEQAFDMIHLCPEKSLQNFDEVLKNEPDNTNAINGKASAYMKLNKIDQAEELFDKSIEITPTPTALINKGIIAKKKDDYIGALDYYNQAHKLNTHIKRITSILKNEVFDSIDLDDDRQKLSIFNKEVNLLIHKGLGYKKMNKHWDSLECYQLAIQKDENSVKYIDSLIDEIDMKIEKQFLLDSPQDDETSPTALKGLEKLLLESNPNEAINHFNRILKNNQNHVETLNYKAITLFYQKNYAQSITCFDKCLKLDEDYHYASFNKSLVLLRCNNLQEAAECFESLLNNPQSTELTNHYNPEDIKRINQVNT